MVRLICALGVLALAAGAPGCGDDERRPPDAAVVDAAIACRLPAEIDCQLACDNYPMAFACAAGAPLDRPACLADCGQAVLAGGNAAGLYSCIQDFDENCDNLAACLTGCRSQTGAVCDPATREPCLTTELCDARSRRCVLTPRCLRDEDCADGYSCTVFDNGRACYRSCSDGVSLPSDRLCKPTHACDPLTFECIPWPCITTAAGLDCGQACASLAAACQLGAACTVATCQGIPTCLADCEQAKASADSSRIAAMGCLQLGHDCTSFANCEPLCSGPPIPDAGTSD